MILRILGILAATAVILFIAYWIWSGGISRALQFGGHFGNPLSALSGTTTGGILRLPGQPESPIDTIDISGGEDATQSDTGLSTQDQLNAYQNQYDQLSAEAKDPKNFGNPSPFKNQVTFGMQNAQDSSPA